MLIFSNSDSIINFKLNTDDQYYCIDPLIYPSKEDTIS